LPRLAGHLVERLPKAPLRELLSGWRFWMYSGNLNGQEGLHMTRKSFAIRALVFGMVLSMSASAFAGSRDDKAQSERYVPADGDIIDILFGGPRYYDQQLVTTAAGACSYHRVGPDANALNKINDHHCGK
jgi:hypothetical protein